MAIKVKIGLKPNNHHDYPDWTRLNVVKQSGQGHMYKQDLMGGWKYDKVCGHCEEGENSPCGMQWGMLVTSPEYAMEATSVFPDKVFKMSEKEAEKFWNEHAYVRVPENKPDINVLNSLKIEFDLKQAIGENVDELKKKIKKALDPNDNEPGLSKVKNKYWKDALKYYGIKILNV